ncbi:MAG: hypothetical protein HOO95_00125 [Gallionella sp.]|nr:hypothetical protein [Gallionella sp.]
MDIKVIEKIAHRMRDSIKAIPREQLPFPMSSFPIGACGDASLLLGAYLVDCGYHNFLYISGERGTYTDNSWTSHAWVAKGELVIDITADQFADAPASVIVASPSAWHQQFEIESSSPSDFRVWSGMGIDHLRVMYAKLEPFLFPVT